MYKNDLSAAHARIHALETALAAARPRAKRASANQQAPPKKKKKRAATDGRFPIYYHAPGTHWPLLRDFARAAKDRPRFSKTRPQSDSLLRWIAHYAWWPVARVIIPAIALLFYYAVVIPSTLVVLVPASLVLAPVAVLGSLKVRGVKQQRRSKLWTEYLNIGVWAYYGIFGAMATAMGAVVGMWLLLSM